MKTFFKYLEKANELEMQKSQSKEEQAALELLSNKKPLEDESGVHKTADKEKINKHKFEETIYKLAQDFFSAGKFNESGKSEDDFDPKEIARGVDIEMEHTTNPLIAKRIALDHIAESWPVSYYDKLEKMEKEIEKEKKSKT